MQSPCLVPKRFAWTLGMSFIIPCILFFNPDTFAYGLNDLFNSELLPTDRNYMPSWIPTYFIWVCLSLMWLEAVLGVCLGCQIHALLVKVKLIKQECVECNAIDWDAIRARNRNKVRNNFSESE